MSDFVLKNTIEPQLKMMDSEEEYDYYYVDFIIDLN